MKYARWTSNEEARRALCYDGAKNVSYRGDESTSKDLLMGARNCRLKGDVKAADTLFESAHCYVEGRLKIYDLMHDAKDCVVKGDVKAHSDVLLNSRRCRITGDVNTRGDVLRDCDRTYVEGEVTCFHALMSSEHSAIKGDVFSTDLLHESKFCVVVGDVKANDVMCYAKSSIIKGNINASNVMESAEECVVEGDVRANKIMDDAEKCVIRGDVHYGGGSCLTNAKDSYVIADTFSGGTMYDCAGAYSERCAVIARKLDIGGRTDGSLAVLTKTRDHGVRYRGRWKNVVSFFEKHPKHLETFRTLGLDKDEINGVGELKSELERLRKELDRCYDPGAVRLAGDLKIKVFDGSTARERLKNLRNIKKIIVSRIRENLECSAKSARLIASPEMVALYNDFSSSNAGDIDRFISEHRTGRTAKAAQKKLLRSKGCRLKAAYLEYSSSVPIKGYVESSPSEEEAHGAAYKLGLGIISDILGGRAAFRAEMPASEVRAAKAARRALRKSCGKDREARAALAGYRARCEQATEELRSSLKPCYTHQELATVLKDLAGHNLSGDIAKKAEGISNALSSNGGGHPHVLRCGLIPKTIENMPYTRDYGCCEFISDENEPNSIFGYMADPTLQMLKFDLGKKSAIAITKVRQWKRKKVLIVDSLESKSAETFGERRGVVNAITNVLRDYAKKSGIDYVAVYRGQNTTAYSFFDSFVGDASGMCFKKDPFVRLAGRLESGSNSMFKVSEVSPRKRKKDENFCAVV